MNLNKLVQLHFVWFIRPCILVISCSSHISPRFTKKGRRRKPCAAHKSTRNQKKNSRRLMAELLSRAVWLHNFQYFSFIASLSLFLSPSFYFSFPFTNSTRLAPPLSDLYCQCVTLCYETNEAFRSCDLHTKKMKTKNGEQTFVE